MVEFPLYPSCPRLHRIAHLSGLESTNLCLLFFFLLQELFVETIAKDAYCCAQQGKRKTLQRRDLDNAIEAVDEFAFLEGTLD